MLWGSVLLAAAISVHALTPAPAPAQAATLYKIELVADQVVWSLDKPRDTGTALVFHRHPNGLLVSLKKADVKRITETRPPASMVRELRPGAAILLGPTGGSSALSAKTGPDSGSPLPGERKDGTALLNPDRPFRPEWDTTRVPGMNLPYPNSPNDYREGKTFGYPPAPAVQEAPGEPPKMPPSSGEPPKAPSH